MDLKKLVNSFEGNFENMDLNLSVDCVIFTIQEDNLKVLLTKFSPKLNWMLPGGFMNKEEESDTSADRILLQRTGAKNIYLHQFKIFSKPDRFSFQALFSEIGLTTNDQVDVSQFPKRVISIGYFALVNYELLKLTGGVYHEDILWADVLDLPELLFDHSDIIQHAVEALRQELYFQPIAYKLLPEKFTMPELQKLYEIILDKPLERSSFQKKMLKWNIYERLEKRREGVAHKRPFLYKFDKVKYKEAIKQGIRFGI